ncbi:MAG: NUDIX domain-containing protein [Cyclobacteriaceae bacterium]|nr:NUDIX domain-containing protein [Cyclobacteriaceae bacterium]
MNLFVNDIPVRILKPGKSPDAGHINHVVDARKEPITKAKLIHHVWVNRATIEHLDVVLDLINSKVPTNLLSLDITLEDYDALMDYLRQKFKIIKAAGGLVRKKDKFLMIYRMKKWDLPKGKKETGERYKETANREINEECNIEVKVGARICTTWHTYTMNKNAMLKKTRWYLMELVDDSKMKPDAAEDIEEARWMTQKEVYHALENSYRSIRFVLERYYRKEEKESVRNRE